MDPRHRFVSVDRLADTLLRWRPELKTEMQKLAKSVSIWPLVLEPPLPTHTRPLDWRNNVLYVGADSPVWAHNLRHRNAFVVQALRDRGLPIARLTVHVMTPVGNERSTVVRKPLAASAAQAIESAARGVDDDDLSAALMRLYRTLHG